MGTGKHNGQKQNLSITEAADFLGVSRPTIYSKLRSGELKHIQVSARTVRIPVEALTSLRSTSGAGVSGRKLTKSDLRDFITREDALAMYSLEKSKFHKAVKAAGIKAVRYGQKALYHKDELHRLFFRETFPHIKEWYTSEELAVREGISRKHICATAHKLGIPVKRAGTVCYIGKEAWDSRKLSPAILEKRYMTADQATQHYHIGRKTFYDKVNASEIEKVKKGNFVFFPIKELERLFKDKTPAVPKEIQKNYIRGCDALKLYHIGQKRFCEETRAAKVEKLRTEGNFVWYRKDQLDRLFKNTL